MAIHSMLAYFGLHDFRELVADYAAAPISRKSEWHNQTNSCMTVRVSMPSRAPVEHNVDVLDLRPMLHT
jgi:hypothetical protein